MDADLRETRLAGELERILKTIERLTEELEALTDVKQRNKLSARIRYYVKKAEKLDSGEIEPKETNEYLCDKVRRMLAKRCKDQ